MSIKERITLWTAAVSGLIAFVVETVLPLFGIS